MDNFNKMTIFDKSGTKIIETGGMKGINEEVKNFMNAITNGLSMPITPHEIFAVTEATFVALESLKTGLPGALKYTWNKTTGVS